MKHFTRYLAILTICSLMLVSLNIACSGKYDDDNDFRVMPLDGGKSVEITGYVGSKQTIRIPPKLQNLLVTSIGDNAFQRKEIINVTIPNSILSIGANSFAGNQLIKLVVPNNVNIIGNNAFSDNKLISVSIGNNVTSIGDGAFRNNQLEILLIPDNITNIGAQSFSDNKLSKIVLPNNVTTVGEGAFQNNQINSIIIPNKRITFDNNVFSGNIQIKNITIGGVGGGDNSLSISRSGLPNTFNRFYYSNECKAGIYTCNFGEVDDNAFILPIVFSEKKMLSYLNQMDVDIRARFLMTYRLYDINNLRSNDNREMLLSTFPNLANERLYILRDVQEYQKAYAEEILHELGFSYTRDEFLADVKLYPWYFGKWSFENEAPK